MEENITSWKSHGFTLMIFVGIVVLSSIFFVLGMLVGRNQGKHAAEVAFAEQSSRKPSVESGAEDFPLDFDNQSTEQKPDNTLQPVPTASAQPVTPDPPASTASKNAPKPPTPEPKADKKPAAPPKPPAPPKATEKTAEAKPPAPKPSSVADVYVQVFASKTEKGAEAELKRVQSKGFKARIRPFKASGRTLYCVCVGPYKDSEFKGAKASLQAKGYKDFAFQK
jgi:cell division protein FtsN